MFLSRLKLDPHHHTSREFIINHYLLHQAIYRGFPDGTDGGTGRILYRLDINRQGLITLLVQSEKEPNWSKATWLNDSLLEPAATKSLKYKFEQGQTLYFLLRANPTMKKASATNPQVTKRQGLLKEEEQIDWLKRKSKSSGFNILSCRTIPEGMVYDEKSKNGSKLRHYAVRFEGILEVIDPAVFNKTIFEGIGTAKGFGFGLLSVARIQ